MESATTFRQFRLEEQSRSQHSQPELVALLGEIVAACKAISNALARGRIAGVLGNAGSENVQGETQKKLDVIANDLVVRFGERSGVVAGMASEEMAEIYRVRSPRTGAGYLALFDPLDGSSNIDVNVSVGTIFSILRCPETGAEPGEADFLQPGTAQVCAGYVVYGTATMLVLTTGQGTHGFTLNESVGEFMLTHPAITIPEDTREFSINMSNMRHWHDPLRRYIDECVAGKDGARGVDFNMRWVGSMVADVHRILSRGGVFLYPGDRKLEAKGQAGKLRLMYEANPMSFVVEQAGGLSSTGCKRLMEVQPESLHQRVSVIMGSRNEVSRIVAYHGDEVGSR